MAARPTLATLREGIEEAYRKVVAERPDGIASNTAVLALVKDGMPAELQALAPQLVDMALVKMLNDLAGRRRGREELPDQAELFAGYRVPRFVSVARGAKKDTATLTIREAELYLEGHARRSTNDRDAPLRSLVEDCQPYRSSDDDTLLELMERRRGAATRG